jgi:hypothetical protein
MVTVPSSLETALSPEWVTSALQQRFSGVKVKRVIIGPVVDRISTNVRFSIECAEELPSELFPHLCLKGYFNPIGVTIPFVGEPEAMFYRDIASSTGVRTLNALYADVDPETRHGVFISEDVIARQGQFLDATSNYTPKQTAESLAELARLHANTWLSSQFARQSWLEPRLGRAMDAWGPERTLDVVRTNLTGVNGTRMPEAVREADQLISSYRTLIGTMLNEMSSAPWCVIHADTHVGNLFLDATGRPCLVDWQLVQRGPWYIDVGYHIASTLTVADRRNNERDLLAAYLDRLQSYGIVTPSVDSALQLLSRGILHGLYLWGITTKVDPSIIAELLHRMGTAAADHDALSIGTKIPG